MNRLRLIKLVILLMLIAFAFSGCSSPETISDDEMIDELTERGYHVLDEDKYYKIIGKLEETYNILDGNEHFGILYDFFDEKRDIFPTEDYFYHIYGHFEDYFIDVGKAWNNANDVLNILGW